MSEEELRERLIKLIKNTYTPSEKGEIPDEMFVSPIGEVIDFLSLRIGFQGFEVESLTREKGYLATLLKKD